MKAITNKIIYIGLAAAVFTTGCLKDLDLSPTDVVPATQTFNTVADLTTGVFGVYAGFSAANAQYATSLLTDEALMPSENNTGRGVITYRWQYDPSSAEPGAAWGNYYDVIDRSNRILKIIDGIPAEGTDLTTRDQLKGELLAIRAYAHLELIRFYAVDYEPTSLGVPLMLESKLSKPKRTLNSELYTQINADLVAAKGLIPANFLSGTAVKTRINRAGISAIQARTALLQKNYDAAITFATEAIASRPLATRAQFPNIWLDTDQSEVLWKLKRDQGDERLGTNYRDLTGRIIYAPAFKLMGLFDQVNDIRFASYFRNLGTTTQRWTVNKFVGGQPAVVNLADAKLLRTAEMYLIRAEAYAKKTAPDLILGAADLNALRTIRITGYVPQVFLTAADLVTAVVEERYKELAFEAHRLVDLRRNALPISRGPQDVALAQGAVTMGPERKEYFFPIPSTEQLANENIEQHPKWK